MNIKFIRGAYKEKSSALQKLVTKISIIILIICIIIAIVYDQFFIIALGTIGSLLIVIITNKIISFFSPRHTQFSWMISSINNKIEEVFSAPLEFSGLIAVKQQGNASYFENIQEVTSDGICIKVEYKLIKRKHKSSIIYIPHTFDVEVYENSTMFKKFAVEYYEEAYFKIQDTEVIEDINEFIKIALNDILKHIK